MIKNPTERFVEFPTTGGKILRGVLHLPVVEPPAPAPAVVMFHGFTGNRMESHWMFVKCSRALAHAGVASLRFDFLGSGESDGEFRLMTLNGELADGRAAVAFLRRERAIDPERIGMIGLSLGGTVAAYLALPLKAKALTLWSAVAHPARLGELIKRKARKIPGKPGAFEYDGRELHPRLIEDVQKVDPIRQIVRYKSPTLIVHPELDEVVPIAHARDFYHAAGTATKELAVIAGADHVYSSIPWENEVIARTVRWFVYYLG